jgi:hypothetical protein
MAMLFIVFLASGVGLLLLPVFVIKRSRWAIAGVACGVAGYELLKRGIDCGHILLFAALACYIVQLWVRCLEGRERRRLAAERSPEIDAAEGTDRPVERYETIVAALLQAGVIALDGDRYLVNALASPDIEEHLRGGEAWSSACEEFREKAAEHAGDGDRKEFDGDLELLSHAAQRLRTITAELERHIPLVTGR